MRAVKILAVILLALAPAGCWGSRETDEIAYVLALGFDKGPGDSVIVTFQIANPRVIAGLATGGGGAGGGGGGGSTVTSTSTVAALPIGAFYLLNTQHSREITLLQSTAFIFSEELARTGLHKYIAPLNRYRETRGTAFVFVCRGKAGEFIQKNRPELEISPSKQYELFSTVERVHAMTPVVQFREFYQNMKSLSGQAVAPLVALAEKDLARSRAPELGKLGDHVAGELPSSRGESQFLGTAVFRGDKMVGMLTGDETRYWNMITGKMARSFLIIEDPKSRGTPLGVELSQARQPAVKVKFDRDRPVIEVHLYQEPTIVGVSSGIDYESPGLKPVLEKHLADLIERRCLELVARTQEEFRSDIFGFGRYARMNFLTRKDWEMAKWHEIYPEARVDISVYLKIRRTGLMLNTQPVRY